MAFANAGGGFLVYGVRNGTFEQIGLDSAVAAFIADANRIQQKINRYADPPLTQLRSKAFKHDTKEFVVVFVPQSEGVTHVVSNDGSFKYPSGKDCTILRKGTIYIRRSAGNKLADARDLDEIVTKRIDLDRQSLLSKISRVVESPQKSEVFILSSDPTGKDARRFRIDDSPESIPIKGMSFSVAPDTIDQEIAGWIALLSTNPRGSPPPAVLWSWYEKRKQVNLAEKQKIEVARFCLVSDVPVFYWLQDCQAESIKMMLRQAASHECSGGHWGNIMVVSAFLGKNFFEQILDRLGDSAKKLPQRLRHYPSKDPFEAVSLEFVEAARRAHKQKKEPAIREHIEEELNQIAASVRLSGSHDPPVMARREANVFDCYLYAQRDMYIAKMRGKGEKKISVKEEKREFCQSSG